jgi:hypothetical protein
MLRIVEGFYRDGKVELAAVADPAIEPSQVLVMFVDPKQVNVQQLQSYLEEVETIQGIQQGLADVEEGNTRPLSEFEAEMQQKYKYPTFK